jgi:hypothetical protein
MVSWWWLVVSGFVGAMVGVVVICLCVAAKRADEEVERFMGKTGRF